MLNVVNGIIGGQFKQILILKNQLQILHII